MPIYVLPSRYTDKTGGCDGCLNWDGMGTRHFNLMKREIPDVHKTNNNGLGWTVEVLEAIYTNATFPSFAPKLQSSLKSSGKSRADLWAFATIVAVEYGVEMNNRACEGKRVYGSEGIKQCHHLRHEEGCKVINCINVELMKIYCMNDSFFNLTFIPKYC